MGKHIRPDHVGVLTIVEKDGSPTQRLEFNDVIEFKELIKSDIRNYISRQIADEVLLWMSDSVAVYQEGEELHFQLETATTEYIARFPY